MSLSPDGRYVAYSRPVEGHGRARDIYLLATDCSGEEASLVEHPADDYGPIWVPDGKSIIGYLILSFRPHRAVNVLIELSEAQ